LKNDIHQNKDWNTMVCLCSIVCFPTWRTTSIKTRIETKHHINLQTAHTDLEERHPSKQGLKQVWQTTKDVKIWSWRTTSIKTRIETTFTDYCLRVQVRAWRTTSIKTRIETHKSIDQYQLSRQLEERHPSKQGLKLKYCRSKTNQRESWRTTSIKTRIETPLKYTLRVQRAVLKNDIHQNKDWNSPISIEALAIRDLEERHPSKQGLKLLRCTNNCLMHCCLEERHPSK